MRNQIPDTGEQTVERGDRARRFAVALWAGEGTSSIAVAKSMGETELAVGHALDVLGFRTNSAVEGRIAGKYSRGPCLECWKPRPRRQIQEERGWRCTSCTGYEDIRMSLPVDVVQERCDAKSRLDQDPARREGLRGRKPQLKKYGKGGA
jgi:hypothetical protein